VEKPEHLLFNKLFFYIKNGTSYQSIINTRYKNGKIINEYQAQGNCPGFAV